MHIIFTVPLWLGIIIWLFQALAKRNAQPKMIQRAIRAPDGRQVTLVVPVDEPVAVSIAKLYPGGIASEYSPHAQIPAQPVHFARGPLEELPERDPPANENGPLIWIMVTSLVVILFIFVTVRSNQLSAPTVQSLEYTPASPALASVVSTPALPHITLKTGANLRNGPSIKAAVIRVAKQGDVFTKFGEENHWLHVGTDSPEGWVAASVTVP